MSDECAYDCSKRPTTVSPNADISGIGVVIGYVATAGITVLIITVSFLLVHDPAEDPFKKDKGAENGIQTRNFRPNPIDAEVLRKLRRRAFSPRLKHASLKCVLAMSDLQILTGFSILISGFMQLRCGISAYHWQMLVYLAWFSSLTHLSCLTFLRNYLYNRPGERIWRLTTMGLLIVMLLFAMIPTGNYAWQSLNPDETNFHLDENEPAPSDYARCYYFYPRHETETFVSMILSMLLLSFGFLVRAFKLHKRLSVDKVGSVRRSVSHLLLRHLSSVYNRFGLENSRRPLIRNLVYRPLLAIFLVLRVGLDTWISMTVEVWWLIASFVWGILNLTETRVLSHGGTSDWTFGQVIPVVLLAAPLLSVFEYLFENDLDNEAGLGIAHEDADALLAVDLTQRQAGEQLPMQSGPLDSLVLVNNFNDHPERDYYANSPWMKRFIWYIVLDIFATTFLVLLFVTGNGNQKLVTLMIPSVYIWDWLPAYQFLALHLFTLFSFLIEDFSLKGDRWFGLRVKGIVNCFEILLFVVFLGLQVLPRVFNVLTFTVLILYGVYIFFALLYKL